VGKAEGGLGGHVYTCASRHVIEYDGQGRSVGYGFVMAVDAFLRGLVVIWDYGENCRIAREIGGGKFTHYGRGGVASAAAYQRHTARYTVYDVVGELPTFVGLDGRILRGGAEYYEIVGAAFNLIVEQPA